MILLQKLGGDWWRTWRECKGWRWCSWELTFCRMRCGFKLTSKLWGFPGYWQCWFVLEKCSNPLLWLLLRRLLAFGRFVFCRRYNRIAVQRKVHFFENICSFTGSCIFSSYTTTMCRYSLIWHYWVRLQSYVFCMCLNIHVELLEEFYCFHEVCCLSFLWGAGWGKLSSFLPGALCFFTYIFLSFILPFLFSAKHSTSLLEDAVGQ